MNWEQTARVSNLWHHLENAWEYQDLLDPQTIDAYAANLTAELATMNDGIIIRISNNQSTESLNNLSIYLHQYGINMNLTNHNNGRYVQLNTLERAEHDHRMLNHQHPVPHRSRHPQPHQKTMNHDRYKIMINRDQNNHWHYSIYERQQDKTNPLLAKGTQLEFPELIKQLSEHLEKLSAPTAGVAS